MGPCLVTIQGNSASDNGGDGFSLSSGALFSSDNNTLIENLAIDNAGWGFWIEELLAHMFEDNECEGSGLDGSNVSEIC